MPATADRRQIKKQRTRALIQDTALELFAAHGYAATSISAIAQAADVAPRTVTWHFPAKEDLVFDQDPFTPEPLAVRIRTRGAGESTLEALRDWMATTMIQLSSTAPDDPGGVWRRRALRSKVIMADNGLRARARSAYFEFERLIADGIGQDLGLPAHALVPRLAALTAVAGLRELYDTWEAQRADVAPSAEGLLGLVDRVVAFVRAGVIAAQSPARPSP